MLSRAIDTFRQTFPLYEVLCAIVVCATVYFVMYAGVIWALCRYLADIGGSCF